MTTIEEFNNFIAETKEKIDFLTKGLVEEAKTLPTPNASRKFLREQKHDFDGRYNATASEQVDGLGNTIIDDALTEINRQASNLKWSDNDD